MPEIIIRSSAKCLRCGEEIESRHRHDFVRCRCGNICVDGGKDYLRRVGDGDFEDTSITFLEGIISFTVPKKYHSAESLLPRITASASIIRHLYEQRKIEHIDENRYTANPFDYDKIKMIVDCLSCAEAIKKMVDKSESLTKKDREDLRQIAYDLDANIRRRH